MWVEWEGPIAADGRVPSVLRAAEAAAAIKATHVIRDADRPNSTSPPEAPGGPGVPARPPGTKPPGLRLCEPCCKRGGKPTFLSQATPEGE